MLRNLFSNETSKKTVEPEFEITSDKRWKRAKRNGGINRA